MLFMFSTVFHFRGGGKRGRGERVAGGLKSFVYLRVGIL